ncbi:MAG: mevalonate kinase [Flavobacteriaceae bacterium TMED179]|nr:MAG: mevalonate kinase [Flavobacteriaceae bacterium TMED179]|tara:strand:- start:18996 stop:19925 length:930 start_codon:yes stop_codon:yes gene_type:complete
MKETLFFAKILLFGEYGIIKGSKGLSIPYNYYSGVLKTTAKNSRYDKKSHQNLFSFANYLKTLKTNLVDFDWEKFDSDLENKLFFDSKIPQGYGVGSSGAIVAAIYNEYALNKIDTFKNLTDSKLQNLKKVFSLMESFFHGKSSGLDPLISYLNLPILINSEGQIETTKVSFQNYFGNGTVFLIDSGRSVKTASMISIFTEKMKVKSFRNMIEKEFIRYSDACVKEFIDGNIKALFKNIKSLSLLVLNNFNPMIPITFYQLWKEGIDSNDYYLKLCGSGGGGFILGFTKDFNKVKKVLKDYQINIVCHF